MDVSAANLGIVPETENIPVLLFYLSSSFKPRPPHCSRAPCIASSRKRSIIRAEFVWTLDFLLEMVCSEVLLFFLLSSPGGSKISSWATYCRKAENTEGACAFSKAKLWQLVGSFAAVPEPSAGLLLSITMLQRCFARAVEANLQPCSDLGACRQEYSDPEKQCGLKFSTVCSGLQMTNVNALLSVVFIQRTGVMQKRGWESC